MNTNQPRRSWLPKRRCLAARLEQSLLLGQEQMVGWVLEQGGEALARRGHQLPPLFAAIRPAGPDKSDEVRQRLVERLLAVGADPNASIGGITPLLLAASHGSAAIVKALLDAGADVGAKDYQGRNALHHAAEANQTADLIIPLLVAGIEFDAQDRHTGLTPLGICARHHNPAACRALLAAGANPNARIDKLDISPREAANSIESRTMIGILEEHCQTALRKLGVRR